MSNWTLKANFAGVAERNVGGGYKEPETGAYKVKITGTEQNEKEGRSSVKFQTVIAEGDYQGSETRLFLGTDLSKQGNLRSWKTAMLSVGFTSAQIEAGEVEFDSGTFDGKIAYIYYKAKDPNDATSQSDRQFITPEQYQRLVGQSSGSIAPAKVNGAPQMTASAPAPKSGNALRNMLGR
jgi:hypothetical protein